MTQDKGRAFGWDDEIVSDGSEPELIPEGEYPFTVLNFNKKWFNGSEKMCPCNYAELWIRIDGPDGPLGKIRSNLFLNEKCYGIFSGFFRAIGQKKHGEAFRPDWGAVPGATGRCRIKVRKFRSRSGEEMESNDIVFLDPLPDEQAAAFPSGTSGW